MSNEDDEKCVAEYRAERHRLSAFAGSVRDFFTQHPVLSLESAPVLHSIRMRLKDEDHLRDKLDRKRKKGDPVAPEELFKKVNDLAGIRLLHIYQMQYGQIHAVIAEQLARRDWVLHEAPVAYTWDPECKAFFEGFGLRTEVKETNYTSIHFVLKPREDSPLCCELQVRTLFEEIWGEVDHWINYPHATKSVACSEQIRVLSRLVGAGSRLTDSIFRVYDEHKQSANASLKASAAASGSPTVAAPPVEDIAHEGA